MAKRCTAGYESINTNSSKVT
ncbi:hypothetical protein CAEBREN_31991 [Caenorhabditis brenneri]|uniref:Uncharacterized protein n=1 Tax=Caenorhabditis brenneri TaxID=135651 RepID=G0MBS3_CAEBE|nr:hypothetical protein CAEBREN_31991 [Caenorhabditis brenneri]